MENIYSFEESISLLKKAPACKFKNVTESVDVDIKLSFGDKKTTSVISGLKCLPHGLGKSVKIALFSDDFDSDFIKNNGINFFGVDTISTMIKNEKFDFDIIIATYNTINILSEYGRVLGPRNLMPSVKHGTVTDNVSSTIDLLKKGYVKYKSDKHGILRCSIGRISFSINSLKENLEFLLNDIKKNKPSNIKGIYVKRLILSTTMGPGLFVDLNSLKLV